MNFLGSYSNFTFSWNWYFYTLKLKFVQVRKFKKGVSQLTGDFDINGKDADHNGMSSFQALATAIAAQVGTGNLAGAATAIVSGGPGAIFWMWISAFLEWLLSMQKQF